MEGDSCTRKLRKGSAMTWETNYKLCAGGGLPEESAGDLRHPLKSRYVLEPLILSVGLSRISENLLLSDSLEGKERQRR